MPAARRSLLLLLRHQYCMNVCCVRGGGGGVRQEWRLGRAAAGWSWSGRRGGAWGELIRNKQHGRIGATLAQRGSCKITLAAARRARARTQTQRVCGGGHSAPTHTYQRAVKTAALHAPHTGAQGAREKKTETRKQAVLASRGGSLSAVQAARDHPTIRGEDAELSACYRSARDRAWSGGATATGHGPRGMELDGPCGCGRRSRSPGGRGRRRLGGRGTCHALAEHAMKVAPSADSEGTKRRLDGRVVRHVERERHLRIGVGVGRHDQKCSGVRLGEGSFPLAACIQHRAGPASSSRSRKRIGARAGGGCRRLARTRRRLRASGARR